MPQPSRLAKAELREIRWTSDQQVREINADKTVQVQFNPESLKVSFSNQSAGGDQRGGSAVQFVGAGTTKLSLELWFDATVPLASGEMQPEGDVRKLTEKVAYFIKPNKVPGENKWKPAGVRFLWGTFMFDGIVDSLDETLEYFSEDGRPLRANVSLGISSQMIQFQFGEQQPPGTEDSPAVPGTQPLDAARSGDTMQQIAGRSGRPQDWKGMAAANNIENPRRLPPGTPINTNAGRGPS
jgi:hypothetical protein